MVVKTADGFKEIASEAFKPYLGVNKVSERIMNTFLITFGVFLAVITAMSIGYIGSKRKLWRVAVQV